MTKERDIVDLANEVVTRFTQQELGQAVIRVRALAVRGTDEAKVQAVRAANSWIKWSLDCDETYQKFRFKVFKGAKGDLQVIEGEEVEL